MPNFKFSPKTKSFYYTGLLSVYEEAGSLPDDLKNVDDSVYERFVANPSPKGMTVGVNEFDEPVWVKAES